MELGSARIEVVGGRFGERPSDDLEGLFAAFPLPDDGEGPFGRLDVLTGWMGRSGPGFVLSTRLHVPFDPSLHTVEVRLRTGGRYIRSLIVSYGDRQGDLTFSVPAAPIVYGFFPYAALHARHEDIAVEAWLVEDGEPIEEGLWTLRLPAHETRRLENALTAVVLALVSTTAALGDAGLTPSGAIEDAAVELFLLDNVGRTWAREIVTDAEAESDRATAVRLRAHISPEAMPRVLGLLGRFARTARAARFVKRIADQLGVQPGRSPKVGAETAAHLDTLGLSVGATPEAVRAAFHRAAALHHPDRATESDRESATEEMKKINEAYAALRRR